MSTSATAADDFGDFRFGYSCVCREVCRDTTHLAADTSLSPPQVDPPGPGDGSGSATARTAAGAIAAVDEASASGVAARRAIALGTALGARPSLSPRYSSEIYLHEERSCCII